MPRRKVILLQLPIPPLVPGGVRGNVPLAGGYLKMFAELKGLGQHYQIEVVPSTQANMLGDQAFVRYLEEEQPFLIGFSCYLWNIDRSLWMAERIRERLPKTIIVIGGPEVTEDNAWVLHHPAVDYFAIGEGEQTFADLLSALQETTRPTGIPGLLPSSHAREELGVKGSNISKRQSLSLIETKNGGCSSHLTGFTKRKPMGRLDEISSPYLNGILDANIERMLLLETIRGCIFNCKFCYYPKSYDDLYFVSEEKIRANLRHARERDAAEVVFLDPTLNQRKDFDAFLKLVIEENPDRKMACFGELRAEGIKESTAALLHQAGFTEVEVGLQSIDPEAMQLMDRKNNLKAVERGCKAMLKEGIDVKVDLIIGLPGDTEESVKRSFQYLKESGIYSDVQVFNLAILPGTAFRHEAEELGLVFQPRPPYYVRRTPTMSQEAMFELMAHAAEVFDMEWDPLPDPVLPKLSEPGMLIDSQGYIHAVLFDLDKDQEPVLPDARRTTQGFSLWFRSLRLDQRMDQITKAIEDMMDANPFATLQIILEPVNNPTVITNQLLSELWSCCQSRPSYMDRYYALQPGRPIGAKRLVILTKSETKQSWLDEVEEYAAVVGGVNSFQAVS